LWLAVCGVWFVASVEWFVVSGLGGRIPDRAGTV